MERTKRELGSTNAALLALGVSWVWSGKIAGLAAIHLLPVFGANLRKNAFEIALYALISAGEFDFILVPNVELRLGTNRRPILPKILLAGAQGEYAVPGDSKIVEVFKIEVNRRIVREEVVDQVARARIVLESIQVEGSILLQRHAVELESPRVVLESGSRNTIA
jgi:hypothetical protein